MSDIKESKVKEIKGIKPYNGTYGMIYYFTVEMENGDKGEVSKKSESGLKVGSPLKYTLETKNGYVKLKEFKENSFKGGQGFNKPSIAAIALESAARVVAGSMAGGGQYKELSEKTPHVVTKLADHFHNWLKEKEGK